MPWDIGLSTGIAYREPIRESLPAIAGAGFTALEVSTAPSHLDIDDDETLRALSEDLDRLRLRVHSLHAPFGHDVNLTSPDASAREYALARLVRAADVLRRLRGKLYVIHPGGEDQRWIWERDARLALSVEGLKRVWEACRRRGLTMVLETPLPHLLGGQLDDFAWILEQLPTEGTAVCLDTSHAALGGVLLECVRRFGDRLVHVQASDNAGVSDDHLPPGEGRIEWPRLIEALVRTNYRGVFMLEVAGHGDTGGYAAWSHACAKAVLGARAWN
jgi:sugar phosphate isomerase/epimerase